MKKTLFLAVIAGAALAGCVKDERIATDSGAPSLITFEPPVVNVPTKAEEIVNNYPTSHKFKVYARYYANNFTSFSEGQEYMKEVECNYDATLNGWKPATNYYWPKTGTLTFAAYSPSDASATVFWNETGFTFTDFTVKVNPAEQIDLLYSPFIYDQTKTGMENNAPYSGVPITFRHALASVVFQAKTFEDYSKDNYKIKITGLTVSNVVSKGTFTQGVTRSTATENTKASESTDTESGSWTAGNERKQFKVLENGNVELGTDAKPIGGELNTTADGGTSGGAGEASGNEPSGQAEGATDQADDNGTRRSDLIVIPQELNKSGNEVNITLCYNIINNESQPIACKVDVPLGSGFTGSEASANGSSSTTTSPLVKWEKGKRYTYTITIGLDKIYFSPHVEDWKDVIVEPTNNSNLVNGE